MKIAHTGFLFGQGLQKSKAEVIQLKINKNYSLFENLMLFEKEYGQPDLVLIEFLGLFPCKIENLHLILNYPVPIAIYVGDLPINRYYLKYILQFFDYVFVDQKNEEKELQKYGIDAVWLPLCVELNDFRENKEKTQGISFVGRFNKERIKRTHLLNALNKHFPEPKDFHIFKNVSKDEMLDIFATSQATINENLFDGLTLRIFQALAAGTLLLTEAGLDGLDIYFKDKKHLLCYTPNTLIPLMEDILKEPEKYAHIARAGQEMCRKFHTSEARVQQLFTYIFAKNEITFFPEFSGTKSIAKNSYFYKKMQSENCLEQNHKEEMLYNCALATYYFTQVNGGMYFEVIKNLEEIVNYTKNHFMRAKTLLALGYISANIPKNNEAEQYFLNALLNLELLAKEELLNEIHHKLEVKISCHLSVFYFLQHNYLKSFWAKEKAIKSFKKYSNQEIIELYPKISSNPKAINEKNELQAKINVFFSIAQLYAFDNNYFELGYNVKRNLLPNNGHSLAFLAWKKTYHSTILDFLLLHLIKLDCAGQILPDLLYAMEQNKITRAQKEKIAEIAHNYYFTIPKKYMK